jgi:hypothetical protein
VAGILPAIPVLVLLEHKDVDARIKSGHDDNGDLKAK